MTWMMSWMLVAAAAGRLTLSWRAVAVLYGISIAIVAVVIARIWIADRPAPDDVDEATHEALIARHRATAPECAIGNTDDAA